MSYLIGASENQIIDGTAYSAYLEYLKNNKDHLSEHVYEFATADWHYGFTSPKSLHDAWLEKLAIVEDQRNSEGIGSTLALSSDGMPLLQLWSLLSWAKTETEKRGMTPRQLLNYLRDEITRQVLTAPAPKILNPKH